MDLRAIIRVFSDVTLHLTLMTWGIGGQEIRQLRNIQKKTLIQAKSILSSPIFRHDHLDKTDKMAHRKKRSQIFKNLLASNFEKKKRFKRIS